MHIKRAPVLCARATDVQDSNPQQKSRERARVQVSVYIRVLGSTVTQARRHAGDEMCGRSLTPRLAVFACIVEPSKITEA